MVQASLLQQDVSGSMQPEIHRDTRLGEDEYLLRVICSKLFRKYFFEPKQQCNFNVTSMVLGQNLAEFEQIRSFRWNRVSRDSVLLTCRRQVFIKSLQRVEFSRPWFRISDQVARCGELIETQWQIPAKA